MLNRRRLIQNGLATAAFSALPWRELLASDGSRPSFALIDLTLTHGRRMLRSFSEKDLSAHGFKSDVGRHWMQLIEPELRLSPTAIAGFTSASTLFCLQYLSRDYGLTLQALAEGTQRPAALSIDRPELIDLNDPIYKNGDAALSWLLAPRRG